MANHYETVKIKGRNGQVPVGSLGLDLISTYHDMLVCSFLNGFEVVW
jgi:hypothetical protein